MVEQVPFLMRGGLTGRVFIVTRYRELGRNRTLVLKKYDVTEKFNELAADAEEAYVDRVAPRADFEDDDEPEPEADSKETK